MPVLSSASASVPSLKFPKPQGSQRLANWISSSSPDIMSQAVPGATVDDDAMAEFEMINTDGETESLGSSVDLVAERLARLDDTVSLASTDNTNDKEDDHQDDDYLDRNDPADYDSPWLTSIGRVADTPPPSHLPLDHSDSQSTGLIWASRAPQGPFSTSLLDTEGCPTAETEACCVSMQQAPPEESQTAKRRPAQLARALLDGPGAEPWIRVVRTVLAAFLLGALVHTVLPSSQKSADARYPSRAAQGRPTPIVLVATPATVTVTVTSTSTVRCNGVHNLVRIVADTADGAMKTVKNSDGSYMPALVSMASKIWNETAVSLKVAGEAASHGLPGVAIHHLGTSIGATAMRVQADTKQRVAHHLKTAEALRDDLSFSVLRAQIQSWLICLRIRGDITEYHRYEALAVEHLRTKHREMMEKRAPMDQVQSSTFPWGIKLPWGTAV